MRIRSLSVRPPEAPSEPRSASQALVSSSVPSHRHELAVRGGTFRDDADSKDHVYSSAPQRTNQNVGQREQPVIKDSLSGADVSEGL